MVFKSVCIVMVGIFDVSLSKLIFHSAAELSDLTNTAPGELAANLKLYILLIPFNAVLIVNCSKY